MNFLLDSSDTLLIVDMQNDFIAGGSMAVAGSETLIDLVNSYIQVFKNKKRPIFASRDFHPANHISFISNGGQWPPHCVADTPGANFHPSLQLPEDTIIISKGTSADREGYSALEDTVLHSNLQQENISRVFVCGLATDYCVHASAKDLLLAGYAVVVLSDAIKAVNVQPGDGAKALKELTSMGAVITQFNNLEI